MILCVNPNAAVDKTVMVENFRLNAIHRPSFELALPGGKGCNVARAAKTLGQQPVVTGWVGGNAGRFIEEGLQAEGIQTAFVHTSVESRNCLSILDPVNGTLTEIYEKGRPVSPEELQSFYESFQAWLPKVDMVTLSGSLPPGVPVCFYGELIGMARQAGVRTMLDSSGEPLRCGLEGASPDVLKCNRAELSGLVGQPLEIAGGCAPGDPRAFRPPGRQCGHYPGRDGGGGGRKGESAPRAAAPGWPRRRALKRSARWVRAIASWQGWPAGCWQGSRLRNALRLAVAAGSANALQIGAGRLRQADVERFWARCVAEEK